MGDLHADERTVLMPVHRRWPGLDKIRMRNFLTISRRASVNGVRIQ
jgi:hypothetical protein